MYYSVVFDYYICTLRSRRKEGDRIYLRYFSFRSSTNRIRKNAWLIAYVDTRMFPYNAKSKSVLSLIYILNIETGGESIHWVSVATWKFERTQHVRCMLFEKFLAPTKMAVDEDQSKLTESFCFCIDATKNMRYVVRWIKSRNVRNYISMNIMSSSSSRVFMSHYLFISVSSHLFLLKEKVERNRKIIPSTCRHYLWVCAHGFS